jgi:hypothetical protein
VAYPQIAAFARLADGSVEPRRRIAGQATKISRAAHDITHDPVNDEIIVANPSAQAILTFRGGADGDEAPIRIIQGPSTHIQSPGYGVTVDPVNDELYVIEGRSRNTFGERREEYILVFDRTTNGDATPLRVIRGPDTMLENAQAIAVDPVRNLIAVGTNNGLLVFPRTANGNVKPQAVIRRPDGRRPVGSNFRMTETGWIVSTNYGDDIAAWHITDSGDVPPAYVLSNPDGDTGGGRVALNPNGKEVILAGRTAVHVYSFPEVFE